MQVPVVQIKTGALFAPVFYFVSITDFRLEILLIELLIARQL